LDGTLSSNGESSELVSPRCTNAATCRMADFRNTKSVRETAIEAAAGWQLK
jgi:hypothetical protein